MAPPSHSPYERAKRVYELEPCARTFAEDLDAHLLHGWVLSTPHSFVMARPVPRGAPPEAIVNPWNNWPRHECDSWFVYLFAGYLAPALDWFPWHGQWIGFERRNDLRFYDFDQAMRRLRGVK